MLLKFPFRHVGVIIGGLISCCMGRKEKRDVVKGGGEVGEGSDGNGVVMFMSKRASFGNT